MGKKEMIKKLNERIFQAADILASENLPSSWGNYVGAYHGTLMIIKSALNGEGYSAPYWTEGRGGWERHKGMMDALADAEKAGVHVFFVDYGSISCSCGAHTAADPTHWEGWPASVLKGDTPWKEAREQGFRPTEADIAESSARWVAENPERRSKAVTALRGHYGQCAYLSVFVA